MAYRVEYARSGRSACKGPIPCKGTKILKGGLRLGTVIEIHGDTSLAWRHWGCVTDKIITNLRNSIGDPEDLDGVEELNEEDQKRISDAFANGHVAEEDVTPALVEAGKGPGGTAPARRSCRLARPEAPALADLPHRPSCPHGGLQPLCRAKRAVAPSP